MTRIRRKGLASLRSIWIGVFFVAFAAFSLSVKLDLRRPTATTKVQVGHSAPDFSLSGLQGNPIELHRTANENKLVLVNFWATWCGPCRLEMPVFEKIYLERKEEGLEILAISVKEDSKVVKDYLDKKPVSFPVLLDPEGRVAEQYGIRAFPTTFLVNSDGGVERVIEGLDTYLKYQIEARLERTSSSKEAAEP